MIGTGIIENRNGKTIVAGGQENHIVFVSGIQAAVKHDRPFAVGITAHGLDIESRSGRLAGQAERDDVAANNAGLTVDRNGNTRLVGTVDKGAFEVQP